MPPAIQVRQTDAIEKVQKQGINEKGEFDFIKSAERAKQLEKGGKNYHVLTGLELLDANQAISHGGWYAYLLRAEILPHTAERRMKLAKEFNEWISKKQVKSYNLQDIQDFVDSRKLDINEFWKQCPAKERAKLHQYGKVAFPHSLNQALRKEKNFVNCEYMAFSEIQKTQYEEYLGIQMALLTGIRDTISDLNNGIRELHPGGKLL